MLILAVFPLSLIVSVCVAFILFCRLTDLYRQLDRRTGRSGYIYIYRLNGFLLPVVKIGRTIDMKTRMQNHRTGAPFGITLLASIRVRNALDAERVLHQRYKRHRIRARGEWFWLSPLMFMEIKLLEKVSRK